MATPVPANLLPKGLRAAPAGPRPVPVNMLPAGLQPQKEKAGLIGSFLEGMQTLGLGDEAAAFASNPNEKTRREFLKKAESKYRQVGFGEGENWEAIKQLIGSSAGQLVAPIAAGLAATPLTTPVGGLAAASAVSGSQYTIQNLLRQAQEQEAAAAKGEKPQAVSIGKALTAATGQTALDLVGGKVFAPIAKAFPFMRPLLGKAGGEAAEKAGAVLADAAEKGTIQFVGGVAKGVGKGVAFEVPQEIGQQALERWQAGLGVNPFTDEEARDEYGQAAIGALVLGGGLGGISGGLAARRAAQPEAEVETEAEAPAGERGDIFTFQNDIAKRLSEVAGPELSERGDTAIKTISRKISNDLTIATPESLASSEKFIADLEDELAAGTEYGPDVTEPLLRPMLKADGTPAVDESGKALYEGALVEAKRMVDEARKRLTAPLAEEAAPVSITPAAAPVEIAPTEGLKPLAGVEEAAPVEIAPVEEAAPVEITAPEGVGPLAKAAPIETAPIEEVAPVDLTPVYEAPSMKARKAAALDITTSIVESLPGVDVASIPSKVYNQISTQIAQQAARGETFDPIQLTRTSLAKNGVVVPETTVPEATAAPEVAAAPEVTAPATAEAPAFEFTPQSYVDRYMAGEGRGDTQIDLEMQQYAQNNAAEIEAEFARRQQGEATSGPTGEPATPVDGGVGARIPVSGEPAIAGTSAPELGGVEPRAMGVSEPAAPDVTVSPDAERGPLRPVPKMEIASEGLVKLADRFGQAEYFDNWAKSVLGTELPSELETAPILERATTMQAGKERLLERNQIDPLIETLGNLKVNLGDFDFFQLAAHAPERNREVAKINPEFPEGGSSLTTAQAQEAMQMFEAEGLLPKYKQAQKKVQELVRFNLQEDVKAGLRSQEDVDRMLDTYKNYVPLKGWAADGDMLTADIDEDAHSPTRREEAMKALRAAAPSGSVNESRRAWGRGSMPFSPTANLIYDSERRARRRVLNMARLPLLRSWKKNPTAFGGLFNVYSETNPKKVPVGSDIAGTKYEPIPMDKLLKDHYANPGKYMIVKDNGVPYLIEFTEAEGGQALHRMFMNMEPKDMEGAAKVAADINNFLKGMVTYKNPIYLLTVAPFRDFSSAIATAMYHQNLKGSPAYKKNLAARTFFYGLPFTGTWSTLAKFVFTGKPMNTETGRLLEEMVREGGATLHTRFMNAQERATAADRAIRRMKGVENLSAKESGSIILEGLNKWIDALADLMDLSARFATYRAATDYGIQPADAARLALDSSLNLTRRGEKARGLDLIFPFFGAGVEAASKTKRIFTSKGGAKVLGALVTYGVLESMWNAAMSGDDDDDGQDNYLDQNATMRMGRAILYYGEGADDYVKLPIDPMVGFFKFAGNRIGDIMLGNASPGDVTGEFISGAISLMSPVRVPQADAPAALVAITPLVGKPIMESFLNRNFFGSPIYQESQFDNAPGSELGRPTTGEGWKWLARSINEATGGSAAVRSKIGLDLQPEIYRQVVEGWLGGPYQLAKQITGIPAAEGVADIPGIKSFVGTGGEYSAQTKYFENSTTIRQIMNRLNKLTPEQRAEQGAKYFMDTDPRIIEAYQIVDKQLDKVTKEQREVLEYMRANPDEFEKGDEKTVLDHYLAEKNELYSAFNYVYNAVKKEQ